MCPNPGQHDLAAVRQVREQLLRRDLRRRREVELPADRGASRPSTSRTVSYSFSSGARRPRVGELAAAPDERRRPGCRGSNRHGAPATRSSRSPPWRRACARGRHLAPDERLGNARSARSDWNQNPLASPWAAESHELERHRRRERRRLRGRFHEPVEGGDAHVALLDRQEEPAVGDVGGWPPDRRGEVVGPLAAARRPGRRARSSAGSARRSLRVPEEVAGWVHTDHHRAVDAASGGARRRSSRCAYPALSLRRSMCL